LYSNLRFVISASLIGSAALIGVLAFLPATLDELLVASAEDPPAISCKQQNWLHFDRNCLSRRGMPWVAAIPTSNAVPVEVPSAAETASEQTLTESSSAATAPEELAQPSAVATSQQQEMPAVPSVVEQRQDATPRSEVTASQQQETPAAPPVAEERQVATPRSEVAPPRPAVPAQPPVAAERHIAKPAVAAQPRPAPKKTTQGDRVAKPTNEALNAVRRFQDNLRDIPVSSYAADGTRRTIVIRPTSIQDVYYYSAPR
jgi:hypothetical protein